MFIPIRGLAIKKDWSTFLLFLIDYSTKDLDIAETVLKYHRRTLENEKNSKTHLNTGHSERTGIDTKRQNSRLLLFQHNNIVPKYSRYLKEANIQSNKNNHKLHFFDKKRKSNYEHYPTTNDNRNTGHLNVDTHPLAFSSGNFRKNELEFLHNTRGRITERIEDTRSVEYLQILFNVVQLIGIVFNGAIGKYFLNKLNQFELPKLYC